MLRGPEQTTPPGARAMADWGAQVLTVPKKFYAKEGEATTFVQQRPEAPEIHDRTFQEYDLTVNREDLEGMQKELDAALADLNKLKPSCVDAGGSYEEDLPEFLEKRLSKDRVKKHSHREEKEREKQGATAEPEDIVHKQPTKTGRGAGLDSEPRGPRCAGSRAEAGEDLGRAPIARSRG
mmetsp:Transcript_3556/g.10380  ORF Transcript_3556/g.10380 Transcript_3556/m.10380 type:complete len:180 (+) Transcript_3556:180-719(+)